MTTESIHAAIEAGKALTHLHKVEGYKPVITQPGVAPLTLSPEKLDRPRFLTAAPAFNDAKAFIAYFNQFKNVDSRIFYNQEGAFLAVLDYHQATAQIAHHGDHVAKLTLKRSPEWETWEGQSEEAMAQQTFAEFIEDNAQDILSPDPETMLRVASRLHATVGAEFRQATNQANGELQIAFTETINGTVGPTTESVPTTFQIGIRPFMGCERHRVDCRLRYRIDRSSGAALKLHYKALHLDWITELSLDGIVAKVRDETGIAPALGAHDAAAFAKGI